MTRGGASPPVRRAKAVTERQLDGFVSYRSSGELPTWPNESLIDNFVSHSYGNIMGLLNVATMDDSERAAISSGIVAANRSAHADAVSWNAIFAGAAAAAALSLILLMLGVGLGLSAVSPWSHDGITAATFGVTAILWITFTQLVASGVGGYIAGRLRTRWIATHTDEVYFRDTAHGFLAWAVATLATAALLTSVIGSIVNRGVQAGATIAGGAVTAAVESTAKPDADVVGASMGYFVDSLFRSDMNVPIPSVAAAEVTRIFASNLGSGVVPADDLQYVGKVVAQRTGLSQADAEKRVTDIYARVQSKRLAAEASAKEAAEKARKASAYAALWLFISLLIGAFVASLSATFGGRQRDT
jgi:hypothetical protein